VDESKALGELLRGVDSPATLAGIKVAGRRAASSSTSGMQLVLFHASIVFLLTSKISKLRGIVVPCVRLAGEGAVLVSSGQPRSGAALLHLGD
jgi:hypothetical protein